MPCLDVTDVYFPVSIQDNHTVMSLSQPPSASPSSSRIFFSAVLQSTLSPSFSKSISSNASDSIINAPFSTTPSPPKLGYSDQQSPFSQHTLCFPVVTRLSPFFSTDFEACYDFPLPAIDMPIHQQQRAPLCSDSPCLNSLEPLLIESPVVRRSLGDVTPPYQTQMSQRCKHPRKKATTTTTTTTAAAVAQGPATTPTAIKTVSVRSGRRLMDSPADQHEPTPTTPVLNQMTSDTPFIDRLRQTTGKLFPASFSPARNSPSFSLTQTAPLRSPFSSDTNVDLSSVADTVSYKHLPFTSLSTPPSKAYVDFWASPLSDPESASSSRSTSVSPTELRHCETLGQGSGREREREREEEGATCATVLENMKRPLGTDRTPSPSLRQVKKQKLNPSVVVRTQSSAATDGVEYVPENVPQPQPQYRTYAFRRTFPSDLQILEEFSAFYRQYPIIPFFRPNGCTTSVLATKMTKKPPPGSTQNEPRNAYDLYTPRFTKGVGMNKVGLCPICFEPTRRGGEGKIEWFAMKVSAYKCYHLQYVHGISSCTGAPFSPPLAFRVSKRRTAEVRKHEKTELLHGKCHKCDKWIPVEGVKFGEVKVKELYWWKHAASCHKSTTIPGETDIYIRDSVYDKLMEYEKSLIVTQNQN